MKQIKTTYRVKSYIDTMEEKIRPWINLMQRENQPNIEKKEIELCQVAKLLATYFEEYSIKELRESPDFLITNDKVEIGLEHQIIIENKAKKIEGFYETICKHVENEIKTTTDFGNFCMNLYFNKGLSSLSKNKEKIIAILKSVVIEKIKNDKILPNPYVYDAYLMKHNQISINANFGAFYQKHLSEELILNGIKKKEKLIDKYRSNTVQNQWLVLVIGQINESSFEVRTDLEIKNNSKFDRVFVYEDFNNQLFELE